MAINCEKYIKQTQQLLVIFILITNLKLKIMQKVQTNIDHNINETEFKQIIALTASLIKYQGKEYLDKLKALNEEYEIPTVKFISERELQTKQVEKC